MDVSNGSNKVLTVKLNTALTIKDSLPSTELPYVPSFTYIPQHDLNISARGTVSRETKVILLLTS